MFGHQKQRMTNPLQWSRIAWWRMRNLLTGSRPPPRRRPLHLEPLEDRIVLDMQGFPIGPMYLLGDFFMDTQNNWWAKGEVKLGLKPADNQPFEELAIFSTSPEGKVWFSPDNPNPEFTVEKAELISMASVPNLSLWETDGSFTFNAAALASATLGVNIYSDAKPFTVAAGRFTLDNIRFVDPDGEGGQKGQIWMQGSLTQAPLTGVNMTVAGSNFVKLTEDGVILTGVSQALSGGLTIGGLGFSIQNLSVSYANETFTLTGTAEISLAENESVAVTFATPGLQVSGGEILSFPLVLNSDLTFSGVKFATKNLRFNYANDTFSLTGQVAATIGSQSLTVTFGQGGTAGLKIVNGELTDLDMMFQGTVSLLGLEVQLGTPQNPITVTYSKATDTTASQFTLSGQLTVPQLWNASVILGSQGHPGLVVKGGDFALEDVRLELSDVNLGALTIDELLVAFTSDTFAVTLDLWFPAGWKVHGFVQWEDGQLNGIDLGLEGNEGIEIADTGIMITGFEGGVFNLQHPADIIVTGKLEAVWLSQKFVQVEGDFTIDRDELVLHGNINFLDGVGKGDVRLVLDWGEQDYSATVKVDWLDGMIQFDAIMDIHDGDDVYVKAKADINVPDHIPFIGGQTLAEVDFVLEWNKNRPDSENFVAAWVDLDFFFFSIDVGVKVDFTGHASLIGSSFIHSIESPPPDARPKVYHYRIPFSVPENVTHGTLQVQWPEIGGNQTVAVTLPNGTTIDQSQFTEPSHNLALLMPLTSRKTYGVGMAGSSADPFVTLKPGAYQLVLTSNYKFSQPPKLTASFGTARPTIETPVVQPPVSLSTPISLSGKVASSLGPNARVTLYVDRDNTGYDGTPIAGATNLPVTVDANGNWTVQVNWNMDGLMPWQYYVYASINDGVNAPVHSAYSAATTPNPALFGTVTTFNQSFRESGLLVFVDKNGNQQFDPETDPYTSTNSFGLYGFDSSALPLNTPFYVGLVLPYGLQMHGGQPSIVQTGPYDGMDGLTVNFQVDEFSAIHGQVTANFDAGNEPLVGWPVYLDANNNGRLDAGEINTLTAADGTYAFRRVPLNTTQTVRLIPPEGYYLTSFDARIVNVSDDQFAIYRHNDFTALPFSTITGAITGYALDKGVLSSTPTPQAGVTVNLLRTAALLNLGGSAIGPYQADPIPHSDFGTTNVASDDGHPIDVSHVSSPAPQAVYQSNRYGNVFTYHITGLTAQAAHIVRLHFAELFWSGPQLRRFDVYINGALVLLNYDIYARAGGKFVAVVESFTASADANGTISVQFWTKQDNAQVNGIEVIEIAGSTATDANGNYSFSGLRAGTYSVAQSLPSGWREVAPFTSDFHMQSASGNNVWFLPSLPGDPKPIDVGMADFNADGKLDVIVLDAVENQTNHQSYAFIYYNGHWDNPARYDLEYGTNYHNMVVGYWGFARTSVAFFGLSEQRFHARIDKLINWPTGFNFEWGWELPSASFDRGSVGDFVLLPRDRSTYYDSVAVFYWDKYGTPLVASVDFTQPEGAAFLLDHFEGAAAPQHMLSTDVNGDGYRDLIVADRWRSPVILFGYHLSGGTEYFGARSFTELGYPTEITALPSAYQVLAADINGDGLMDLGVFDTNGEFHYAIQDQAGNFSAISPGLGVLGKPVGSAFFHDMNGDLLADLVWVVEQAGSQAVHVVLNSGETHRWFRHSDDTIWGLVTAPTGIIRMTAGDLTGDGLAELIVIDKEGYKVQVLTNRSMTRPTPLTVTVAGNTSTGNNFVNAQFGQVAGKVVADIDRDGRLTGHEPGLAGATVFVDLNRNGRLDAGEPQMTTGPHGVYAFDGLANGTYLVRVVPQVGQKLVAPDTGAHEVALTTGLPKAIDKHFVSVAGYDRQLALPPGPSHWTLLGRGDRLEIEDAVKGIVASYGLEGLYSLIIVGTDGVSEQLTLDLSAVGDLTFPGGVVFRGGAGGRDALRLVLGAGHDDVLVDGPQAVLNSGLTVRWNGIEMLAIDAGPGDDVLRVSGSPVPAHHAVELQGGPGNDTYVLATRRTDLRLTDSEGTDTLDFSTAASGVLVNLSWGRGQLQAIDGLGNWLRLQGAFENIIGSNQNDHLTGNAAANLLRGGGGNDILRGGNGNDELDGGPGNDVLYGGPGDDALLGGAGNDTLHGEDGNDVLDGGDDNDFLLGGRGDDTVLGGAGNDILHGEAGNDLLDGGAGNDFLYGGQGDDMLLGDAGNDVLHGEAGNDVLIGGWGMDYLFGLNGTDLLIGGTTAFDHDKDLLRAVWAEWRAPRTYKQRVQNLVDGTGPTNRLNGDLFLNAGTLYDDRTRDYLFGGLGEDWFLGLPGDRLLDRKPSEQVG